MKRIHTLAFLLLITLNCKAQFFQEDFSGVPYVNDLPGPANQWTKGIYVINCGEFFELSTNGDWYCEDPSSITTGTLVYPGLANKCAKVISGCDDFPAVSWLTSPWIDCSGQSQVFLTFANMRSNCGEDFYITIYDSLTTHTVYMSNSTTPNIATFDTVDISAYAANKPKVAFEFTLDYGGGALQGDQYISSWIIDDISLYNPSCSINNKVNSSGIYDSVQGQYTFCAGDSIKLFLNQPQSTQTFQWYYDGSVINGAIDSMYYASDSGLYSCKITDTCGYAFTKDLSVIEINIITPSISCTGDLVYCPPGNSKIIYAGLSTDPFTYQWYNNGLLIPNQNNYWLNCTQLTPYYTMVTTACGIYSTDTVTIAQGTIPTATITASYPFPTCYPTPFTLNAYDSAGYTFQWQQNFSSISGQVNKSFSASASQASNYWCVVTDVLGCSNNSNSIYAGGNSGYSAIASSMGPTSFCAGDSVLLVANQGTGYTYQWFNNNALIPLATQYNYTAKQPGTYNFYLNNNICVALSNSITVYVPCVSSSSIPPPEARNSSGEEQNETGPIQINTFAENSLSIINGHNIASINIYNGLGKLIASEKTNSNVYTLNTAALQAGLYFIAIQTSSGITKSKFIVARSKR